MNDLMQFNGVNVEVLQFDNMILFNPYHVGSCLELNDSAVRMALGKMNEKQVVKLKNSDVKDIDFRKLNNRGENFLTASGVYKLIFKSRKPDAEKFADWVTDEVLPSIFKTGTYSVEPKQMELPVIRKEIRYKDFCGLPVLTIRDISKITLVTEKTIYSIMKDNNFVNGEEYLLLTGEDLQIFKKKNEEINKNATWLNVIFAEGIHRLAKILHSDELENIVLKGFLPKKEESVLPKNNKADIELLKNQMQCAALLVDLCERYKDSKFRKDMNEVLFFLSVNSTKVILDYTKNK